MDEANSLTAWEGYVDWRNRTAFRGRHGGVLAAAFVLVVEVLENLAFLANASNLVLYLSKIMRFSPSESANAVTGFMGTAFLLALLGGFLADSSFTTFRIYIVSAAVEFVGLAVLTVQAHTQSSTLESAITSERMVLFAGLYLVALGIGGIKGSLPPHGAEQFDENTPRGRKLRSAFFNYFVFCLSFGALIAVTFVVWLEDNKGWQWGFGVSTLTIFLSIPVFLLGSPFYRIKLPNGSPAITIFKVLAAVFYSNCRVKSSTNTIASVGMSPPSCTETQDSAENKTKQMSPEIATNNSLGFLNGTITENRPQLPQSLQCTTQQIEDVKIVIKILPIFMSSIMLNCCLAQLSTFSVQQAATMNTKIGNLIVPPAALPVFPVIFLMILAPIYSHIIVPLARKVTKTEMGITHLQRIGTGLLLSIIAMAVAALVETKRKKVAIASGLRDSTEQPLPVTFLWVSLQYLFLGSADLFTLAGMMEFFFTEAPLKMRSLSTALAWTSLAMGYYLSSVLVSAVNLVTGLYGHTPWLSGKNLNDYHLERFYWLLCALSSLNFLHYLFWASRYVYRANQG